MEILDWLNWDALKAFANSSFATSFLGAMAGAWGGAWAAQRIADRAKIREQLLQEIRNSNLAIDLAHSICSAYLSFKRQYILELYQRYQQQRSAVQAHHRRLQTGEIPPGTPLDIGGLDLRSLNVLHVRIDRFEDVLMEKLSVSGRPRPLLTALTQSIAELNTAINHRNEMVAACKAQDAPLNTMAAFIFGLPQGGSVDMSFADVVEALYRQTDNCIQFSRMLCSDIAEHGLLTRKEFKRRYRGDIPRIQKVVWDAVEREGLFPGDQDYASRKTGFLGRISKTRGGALRSCAMA